MSIGVGPGRMFFKLLATSSGATALNVAGSSSTGMVRFYVESTRPVEIERVCMSMHGDTPLSPQYFGAATSALTNGIRVVVTSASSGELVDFLDGVSITHNADWALLAGIDAMPAAATSAFAAAYMPVRWTISKAGRPLHLGSGEKLTFQVRDNIASSSFFHEMQAMVQGWYS